ncbi:MAG: hypothetical protein ACTSXX_12955 [Candidatus Baldrarchaeia archaeon]
MGNLRKKTRFIAKSGDKIIAEAESLEDLAKTLQARNIDPRHVEILSSEDLFGTRREHMGFRIPKSRYKELSDQ